MEIFSAGCGVCEDAAALVRRIACSSCDIEVLDMHETYGAARARDLGIRSVPAVVVDGKLADCCAGAGISEEALRAEGIGQPL